MSQEVYAICQIHIARCPPILHHAPNLPIFISVQERREDAVQVGASANEEQDDQQEGLELEDTELDGCVVSM